MMKKFGLVAVALMSLVGSSCALASNNDTIRYKVTVTVSTPEGDRVGYAVREASKYKEKSILPEQGGTSYNVTKGEAVVVDMGKHGVLFSRMNNQDEAQFIFKAFFGGEKVNKLTSVEYPYAGTLTFTDLSDPTTAKAVEYKNLEKSFGEGVVLKNITAELTDEPVTWSIERYLPWLPNVKMSYLNGKHINGPAFYEQLDGGAFQRGEK